MKLNSTDWMDVWYFYHFIISLLYLLFKALTFLDHVHTNVVAIATITGNWKYYFHFNLKKNKDSSCLEML